MKTFVLFITVSYFYIIANLLTSRIVQIYNKKKTTTLKVFILLYLSLLNIMLT